MTSIECYQFGHFQAINNHQAMMLSQYDNHVVAWKREQWLLSAARRGLAAEQAMREFMTELRSR